MTARPPTPDPEENPVPETTAETTTAEKIAAARAETDQIRAESESDPMSLADDLNGWRRREAGRQDRALALEQRVRQLTDLGQLADDPAALNVIRGYTTAVAEHRQNLAHPIAHRAFRETAPRQQGPGAARAALIAWWRQIETAVAALGDSVDAHTWTDARMAEWFAARSAVAEALLVASDRLELPRPEGDDGTLPGGSRYGVHRPGGDHA